MSGLPALRCDGAHGAERRHDLVDLTRKRVQVGLGRAREHLLADLFNVERLQRRGPVLHSGHQLVRVRLDVVQHVRRGGPLHRGERNALLQVLPVLAVLAY